MFAHFADTNTIQLLAIQTTESQLALLSKISQKTGLARFAELQNPTSKKLNRILPPDTN